MRKQIEPGIFKPTRSRLDAKSEVTTKAVREIIRNETVARTAKSERLRAATVAREAAEDPQN